MKVIFSFVAVLVLSLSMAAQSRSFYDFSMRTIDGKEYKLADLKGKKVLVVSVASKCGLIPQCAELQELCDQYKNRNFMITAFPADNFVEQKPGTNEEITKFCPADHDVTFPMMAKISVRGKDMTPLYQWLTEKELNGKQDASVQWNFQKFMIGENGNWVGPAAPKESPFSETIIS